MAKFFIILNLLASLVLLPVAQTFAMPVSNAPSPDEILDASAHCPDMKVKTCESGLDCEMTGMHCVDSINLAIIFENQLSASAIKDTPQTAVFVSYHYLD